MKFILSILVFFALLIPANAQDTTLFESVLKVNSGNSYGTATFINEDASNYYALTNFHVTEGRDVRVKAYNKGHESTWISADTIWNAYRPNEPVDISLLRISKSSFPKNYKPTIIKFLSNDRLYNIGDTITSIGCEGGDWPEAFQGHITNVQGGRYYFKPIALPGRSGSVIFDKNAKKAIGLIAWHNGEYGIAMTAETIQNAVNGGRSGYYYDQPYKFRGLQYGQGPKELLEWTQCCPDGNCPRFRPFRQEPDYDDGPEQPYDDGPERYRPDQNDDGEQFRIFPTQPPNDDPYAPQAPDSPESPPEDSPEAPPAPDLTPELLEDNKKFAERMDGFDKKLTDLEEKQDNLSTDIGSVKIDVTNLSNKVTDLSNKIDQFLEDEKNKEVVTPGNIYDHLKKDKEFSAIPGLIENNAKTTEKLAQLVESSNNNVDRQLKEVQKNTNSSVKEYIEKTIIQEKAVDRNYGLVETATTPSILSIAGLIAMYFYKRWFGGTSKSPPFVLEAKTRN